MLSVPQMCKSYDSHMVYPTNCVDTVLLYFFGVLFLCSLILNAFDCYFFGNVSTVIYVTSTLVQVSALLSWISVIVTIVILLVFSLLVITLLVNMPSALQNNVWNKQGIILNICMYCMHAHTTLCM